METSDNPAGKDSVTVKVPLAEKDGERLVTTIE
jgi:hypothetical protein